MPSGDSTDRTVTLLLQRWQRGDAAAAEELMPLVYDQLRRIASAQMRAERDDHTLQPTALVHEAYARLVKIELPWRDRVHFHVDVGAPDAPRPRRSRPRAARRQARRWRSQGLDGRE